ncbi:MAG: hypothetical protein ACOC5M_02165 [Chloroflexota bacterium]
MACDRTDPPPTSTPTPPSRSLTGEEVLDRSRDAVAGAEGFRFELTHRDGVTALADGISVERAEGAAVKPGSYRLEADTRVGSDYLETRVVVIGEDTWVWNSLNSTWSSLGPDDTAFGFFNPPELLARIMGDMSSPQLTAPGGEVYSLAATLPASALEPLTGTAQEDMTVSVEVQVNADSFYPEAVEITGPVTPSEADDIVRLIHFWDFEEELTIEPPG